jgi:hypothetical protein
VLRRLLLRVPVVLALVAAVAALNVSPAAADSCSFHQHYVEFYLDHAEEAAGVNPAAFQWYMRQAINQLQELINLGC